MSERRRVFDYGHRDDPREVTARPYGRGRGRNRGRRNQNYQNNRNNRNNHEYSEWTDPIPQEQEPVEFLQDPRLARRNERRAEESSRWQNEDRHDHRQEDRYQGNRPRGNHRYPRGSSYRGGRSNPSFEDTSRDSSRSSSDQREFRGVVENSQSHIATNHLPVTEPVNSRFTVPVPETPLSLDLEVDSESSKANETETCSPNSHVSHITVELAPTSSSGCSSTSNVSGGSVPDSSINPETVDGSGASSQLLRVSSGIRDSNSTPEKKRKFSKELDIQLFGHPPNPTTSSSKKSTTSTDPKPGSSSKSDQTKTTRPEAVKLTEINIYEKSDDELRKCKQSQKKKSNSPPTTKPSPKKAEETDVATAESSSNMILKMLTIAQASGGAHKAKVAGILQSKFKEWKEGLANLKKEPTDPETSITESGSNPDPISIVEKVVETDGLNSETSNPKESQSSIVAKSNPSKRKASESLEDSSSELKAKRSREEEIIENVSSNLPTVIDNETTEQPIPSLSLNKESSGTEDLPLIGVNSITLDSNTNCKTAGESDETSSHESLHKPDNNNSTQSLSIDEENCRRLSWGTDVSNDNSNPVSAEETYVLPFLFEDLANDGLSPQAKSPTCKTSAQMDDDVHLEKSTDLRLLEQVCENSDVRSESSILNPTNTKDSSQHSNESSSQVCSAIAVDKQAAVEGNEKSITIQSQNDIPGKDSNKCEDDAKANSINDLRNHSSAEDISEEELSEEGELPSSVPKLRMNQIKEHEKAVLSPISSDEMLLSDGDEERKSRCLRLESNKAYSLSLATKQPLRLEPSTNGKCPSKLTDVTLISNNPNLRAIGNGKNNKKIYVAQTSLRVATNSTKDDNCSSINPKINRNSQLNSSRKFKLDGKFSSNPKKDGSSNLNSSPATSKTVGNSGLDLVSNTKSKELELANKNIATFIQKRQTVSSMPDISFVVSPKDTSRDSTDKTTESIPSDMMTVNETDTRNNLIPLDATSDKVSTVSPHHTTTTTTTTTNGHTETNINTERVIDQTIISTAVVQDDEAEVPQVMEIPLDKTTKEKETDEGTNEEGFLVLNESTGVLEERQNHIEGSTSNQSSEVPVPVDDNNTASVIESGSGLDTSALEGRNDLVIVNIDSFLSPSDSLNSEDDKTPSPDMPQLVLTEADFPVLSIPERDEESESMIVTSDVEQNISLNNSVNTDPVDSPVVNTAMENAGEGGISEENDSLLVIDLNDEVALNALLFGEQRTAVNTGESAEGGDNEEPILRIRSDLFADDVDEKTEALLSMIYEKGKSIQQAVCSGLMKFQNIFQTGTPAAKMRIFREVKGVFSKAWYIMDRFDVQLVTEEVLKHDLPSSNEYDMYKHITVEEMAEYFVYLYRSTWMLRQSEYEHHKSNIFLLHYRMTRILKYYAVSKMPSQTEGNFMNIIKAAEGKIENFENNLSEIVRIWDYVKSFSYPIDEHLVLQEHATVGLKGFGTLVDAIMHMGRKRTQLVPAAATQSIENPTNDDIEIVGGSMLSAALNPSPHLVTHHTLPIQVTRNMSTGVGYTVGRTSPISPAVSTNSQHGFNLGMQSSSGTNTANGPPSSYGSLPSTHSIQLTGPSTASTRSRSSSIEVLNSSFVPQTVSQPNGNQIQPSFIHQRTNNCASGSCPTCNTARSYLSQRVQTNSMLPQVPTSRTGPDYDISHSHNPHLLSQLTQGSGGTVVRGTNSRYPAVQINPNRHINLSAQQLQQNQLSQFNQQQVLQYINRQHSNNTTIQMQQQRQQQQQQQQQLRQMNQATSQQTVSGNQVQMVNRNSPRILQNRIPSTYNIAQFNPAAGNSQYNLQQSASSTESYSQNPEYATISPAASPQNNNETVVDEQHFRSYGGSGNVTVTSAQNNQNEIQIRRVYSLSTNTQQPHPHQQLPVQLNPQNPNHHTTFTQQLQRRRGAARSVPENSPYASASVAQLLQAVPGSLAQLRPNTVGNYQNQQQAGVIGFQTSQQSQSTNNRQQITGQGQVETTQNQAAQLEPPTSQ